MAEIKSLSRDHGDELRALREEADRLVEKYAERLKSSGPRGIVVLTCLADTQSEYVSLQLQSSLSQSAEQRGLFLVYWIGPDTLNRGRDRRFYVLSSLSEFKRAEYEEVALNGFLR